MSLSDGTRHPWFDPFPLLHYRPGRRIVDDDRLQQLLQPSEIVGKKLFRWLHLQKTLKIDVKFFEKTSENIEKQYLNQCFTKKIIHIFWPF